MNRWARIPRDKLELLIRIISDLSSIDSESLLIRHLIRDALDFTGAERGFLVQKSPDSPNLRFFDSGGEISQSPIVSFSSISQVMETGVPICMVENTDGQRISSSASILALDLKTIMCAPLIVENSQGKRDYGVLYVDSRIVTQPFSREDLDFFSLLSRHAAIVFDHLNLTRKLERDYKLLHDKVRSKYDYHKIVGHCDSMTKVYQTLDMIRDTNIDILITGDTGTGKELIAKAVHYSSPRSNMPLKQLNCAALPEGLVEAELFGVEKNVATEVSRRAGKIEEADGGSLFLDEIGDMPLRIQNRLLRFLEERRFRRIGGREEIHADVRIIAATNKNLDVEVAAGRFRDALRYRIDIINIHLPPLKDRDDDLELLAQFFLKQIVDQSGINIQGFTAEAWKLMKDYNWPGNVRELKHRVQSAAFLAKAQLIDSLDLGLRKSAQLSDILPLAEQKAQYIFSLISRALLGANQDPVIAAETLGISNERFVSLQQTFGSSGIPDSPGTLQSDKQESNRDSGDGKQQQIE